MIRIAAKSVTIPLFRVGVAEQADYGKTIMAILANVQRQRVVPSEPPGLRADREGDRPCVVAALGCTRHAFDGPASAPARHGCRDRRPGRHVREPAWVRSGTVRGGVRGGVW